MTSARVALQLMQAGFSRVSVVRGGFPALVNAGVELTPRNVTLAPDAGATIAKDSPPVDRAA